MKNILTFLIMIVFTILLVFLINKTYTLSKSYENIYSQYAKSKTLDKNIQNEVGNLISSFVGLFAKTKVIHKIQINYKEKLNKIKEKIIINIKYILIIIFVSMFFYFILNKIIILSFLYLQSMIFLVYGLISPIFLMYVTQEFASNTIILQFESNSIISSIEKLFAQDNYFVGGIILIFSVIFPILKTIVSFVALHIKSINILSKVNSFSSSLSKLSMTDVFVLSIFLVYLSPKSDGIIKTELEVGFLFFFIYVVISLFIAVINKEKS